MTEPLCVRNALRIVLLVVQQACHPLRDRISITFFMLSQSIMRRRALVVGINYSNSKQNQLKGCINDAVHMRELLEKAGFDVIVLRDDRDELMPTANRIIHELHQLVTWAHEDCEIAFHFSGHGVGITDTTGDETDGRDECIVGCDNVVVRDDTIHRLMKMLPAGVKATLVMDCCHSGTLVDLTYHLGRHRPAKGRVIQADVLMMSGCMDAQTSADTIDLRPKFQCHSGAMTSAVLFCLKYAKTWQDLIKLVRFVLRRKGFTQVPQLSASFPLHGSLELSVFEPIN